MFSYDYEPRNKLDAQKTPVKQKLLTEGKGTFTIKAYYDKDKAGNMLTTKDGVPKINLLLNVVDALGNHGTIYETFCKSWGWKFAALSDAIGMPGAYNEGGKLSLAALVGAEGQCMIKTDTYFSDNHRSVIGKFLPHPSLENPTTNAPDSNIDDDDIPF